MKVEIRGRHVEITNTIREYVKRRLGFALDRFAERIRSVTLRIRDVNSSRGGIDKHCQLSISFTHFPPATLESRDTTVQGAIDRVADRIGGLVAQRIRRIRERRRFKQLGHLRVESSSPSRGNLLHGGSEL